MIGKTISHYKIEAKLGAGGMGVVYRATDLNLDRPVALKFLPAHLVGGETERKRFTQEAKAASALDHRNVGTIYHIGQAEDGQTFIAMAYYDGEGLDAVIARGPMPLDRALDIATQVGEGLAAAHVKDIVHRDIKPANVLVTESGEAKILDFGLARVADATRLTQSGVTVGTVAYMSPEQARGDAVDHRTDVWALAALLYESLVGHPPFHAGQPQAVMYAIMNEEPEPLTAQRAGLPVEIDRVVGKALAKDPAERYQSVDDMLVDLRALRKSVSGDAPRSDGAHGDRAGARHRPDGMNPHRMRILTVAVIVLAVAITIVVSRSRDPGQTDPTLFAAGVAAVERSKRIAVLPFDNISASADDAWLADGMTEEITSRLSRSKGLRVIARTSAERYRDTEKDVAVIGNELGVGTVLEGSVRVAGDALRITVQLIDTATQVHLWSRDYNRQMDDVFEIQRDVAGQVATALEVQLSASASADVDLGTYRLYLQGRHLWNQRTLAGFRSAQEAFRQVIERDPGYAPAYAGMADTYVTLGSWDAMPMHESHPAALEWAKKALALDDELAEAHTSMAGALADYYWEWDRAVEHFERAIELDPSYATAHQWYAESLRNLGRFEEALVEARIAGALDPLSPAPSGTYGRTLFVARRFEESVQELRRVVDRFPDSWFPRFMYAISLNAVGDGPGAIREMKRAYEAAPQNPSVAAIRAYLYAVNGRSTEAHELIDEMHERERQGQMPAFAFVNTYMALGNADRAFEYLEKAYEERDWKMAMIATEPLFDLLRDDPRYEAFIKKMNLEGADARARKVREGSRR